VPTWPSRTVARVILKNETLARKLKIFTALQTAAVTAVGEARNLAKQWVAKYLPRRTGMYAGDVSSQIDSKITGQFPFEVRVGAPMTEYASYVNRMRGVNGTNPKTVEGAQGLLILFIRAQVRRLVKAKIQAAIQDKMGGQWYRTFQRTVGVARA